MAQLYPSVSLEPEPSQLTTVSPNQIHVQDSNNGDKNANTQYGSIENPTSKTPLTQSTEGVNTSSSEESSDKDPLDFDSGATSSIFLFNITKAYLGGGCVALPAAVGKAGFVAGVGSIMFLAFLLNHTMKLLIRMKLAIEREYRKETLLGSLRHELSEDSDVVSIGMNDNSSNLNSSNINGTNTNNENSNSIQVRNTGSNKTPDVGFGAIGQFCCGCVGKGLINFAIFCSNIGITIGYLCLINDTLVEQFPISDKHIGCLKIKIFLLAMYPVLLGACLLSPAQLGFSSILGNIAVIGTILLVTVVSAMEIANPIDPDHVKIHKLTNKLALEGGADVTSAAKAADAARDQAIKNNLEGGSSTTLKGPADHNAPINFITNEYPESFGLILFSFCMHGTILGQFVGLKPSQRHKAPNKLNLSAGFCAVLYAIFAGLAYVAYGNHHGFYDAKILENVAATAKASGSAVLIKMTSVTSLFLAFAVFCSIPLFMDAIFTTCWMGWSEDKKDRKHFGMTLLKRAVLLFVITIVVMQANFSAMLNLTGAICMSWMSCILPAIFYFCLAKKRVPTFELKSRDGMLVMFIGLVGVVGCVLGTYFEIKKLTSANPEEIRSYGAEASMNADVRSLT